VVAGRVVAVLLEMEASPEMETAETLAAAVARL